MNWTAQKTAKGLSNGKYWVQVQYLAATGEKAEDVFRSRTLQADWPDRDVRARLQQLDALDLTQVKLGAINPKPADPPVIPPTQAQLDEQAFLVLLNDWQQKKMAVTSGLTKTLTQQDVDHAYALMKTAYKEEYSKHLVGIL